MNEFWTDLTRGNFHQEAQNFLEKLPKNYSAILLDAISKANSGELSRLKMLRALGGVKSEEIDGVQTSRIEIQTSSETINTTLIKPDNAKGALLYLHGGGWSMGSAKSCETFCKYLAKLCKIVVVCPDYKLAPEFRYPNADEDCFAIFQWMQSQASELKIKTEDIFLGGDSAGGQLAISVINKALKIGEKTPKGLALIYPATSFENRNTDESWQKFGKNYALDADLMNTFITTYIPEENRHEASPLNFDTLSDFPPTLIISSECDILRDQGAEFANKLRERKVKVRKILFKGATHMFVSNPQMRESLNMAVEEIADFLKQV